MRNPLRDEWLHGPDADPDPVVAEAVALITEYQLGMLSDIERASVEHRLKTDQRFAEIVEPILFAARMMRAGRPANAPTSAPEPRPLPRTRSWVRRYVSNHVTPWRIAAAFLAVLALDQGASVAYGAILRSRIPPASVTFTNAPLPVVMAELRRRYHVDVQMCDPGFQQDRVTLTIKDAPIEEVADSIAVQTRRFTHWYVPFGHWTATYILLLQPEPDMERGLWYVLTHQYFRSFTTHGCHR